jgi:RNA polymerase sigma-70 factor (ECF subfamily)
MNERYAIPLDRSDPATKRHEDTGELRPCPGVTCRQHVYQWAYRLSYNLDDAEDLLQEVCLRCLRSRNTFRGEAELSTWLFQIMVNAWRDRLRMKRRQRESAQSELSGVAFEEAMQTARAAATHEAADALAVRVRAALSLLTPREHVLLEWKYLEGRSHAEIAGRLGIHEESAEKAVQRARKAFRRAYAVLLEEDP